MFPLQMRTCLVPLPVKTKNHQMRTCLGALTRKKKNQVRIKYRFVTGTFCYRYMYILLCKFEECIKHLVRPENGGTMPLFQLPRHGYCDI